jgi:hypothetical protein
MAVSFAKSQLELLAHKGNSACKSLNPDTQRLNRGVTALRAVIDQNRILLLGVSNHSSCHFSDVSWIATIIVAA